jgi:hypothetical protein
MRFGSLLAQSTKTIKPDKVGYADFIGYHDSSCGNVVQPHFARFF